MHLLSPGVHTFGHAPETHGSFTQVSTGVSARRSGPHCTTVSVAPHTSCPELAPTQVGSIAAHVPWLAPGVLSQFWSAGHVWPTIHTPPGPQMSAIFCALPLHASNPTEGQVAPRTPTAPDPASAFASLSAASSPASFAPVSLDPGAVVPSPALSASPASVAEAPSGTAFAVVASSPLCPACAGTSGMVQPARPPATRVAASP